ncbi:MAG: hypothetical protein ACTTJP_03545 [Candidatus Onthovivens sp.]
MIEKKSSYKYHSEFYNYINNEKYNDLNLISYSYYDYYSMEDKNNNPNLIIKKYLEEKQLPYYINVPATLFIEDENTKQSFTIVNYNILKEHKIDLIEGNGLEEDLELQFFSSLTYREYKVGNSYNFKSLQIMNNDYSKTTTGLNLEFNNVKCNGKFYHTPIILGEVANYQLPILVINNDKLFNNILNIVFNKYLYEDRTQPLNMYLTFIVNINKSCINELTNIHNKNIKETELEERSYNKLKPLNLQDYHKSATFFSLDRNLRDVRRDTYLMYFILSTIFIYLYYILINTNSNFDKKMAIYLLCGGNKKSILISKFIQLIFFVFINISLLINYVYYNYNNGAYKLLEYILNNRKEIKAITSPKFLYIGIISILMTFLITGMLQILKFKKINISQILNNRN